MFNFNSIVVGFVGLSLVFGSIYQQENEKRKLKRVRKPVIPVESDIYFNDIFSEGLVGDRPEPAKPSTTTNATPQTATPSNSASGSQWSKVISGDAIEDEIKKLNLQLQRSVTSPSGFNSQSQTVRQQFSVLSMLFAIIHEYDTDVRWKKFSRTAQIGFAEAAKQARNPNRQSFEVARSRKDDLASMVRGGGIDVKDNNPELYWPDVVGRRPMMVRLETGLRDNLKTLASNANDFNDNKEKILQEANMIAAISKVLIAEEMDAADDDGYVDFSNAMGNAAGKLKLAVETGDFDAASKAINMLEQSCNDCHGEWR